MTGLSSSIISTQDGASGISQIISLEARIKELEEDREYYDIKM